MTHNKRQEPPPARHRAVEWRWYHFYFLLAVFDLLVILGSLILYHQTLDAYQLALHKLARTHARQRWAASLSLTLIKLNSPGNDIFRTRDVVGERDRFERGTEELEALMGQARDYDINLKEVQSHLKPMMQSETDIFDRFAMLDGAEPPGDQSRAGLEAAAIAMASMDHHHAAALISLTELDQLLLMRVDRLLTDFGQLLMARGAFEKYFLAIVALILIGIFWYGRKLQGMHERMVDDEQQVVRARHERLAAVGQLCTAVAHGIRNPLAAISSSAQLGVSAGTVDGATHRRLNDILTECRRLDHRVTRLIDFAAGSAQAFEEYDLREVIDQATDEVMARIGERHLRLTKEFDGAPLTVRGDRERMVQAVLEIITNAMDFVTDGGHIGIRAHRMTGRPACAEVEFLDDGSGIPDAVRPRVFDLFFTTRAEGTGIGLASVKHTVEMHGGEVSIDATTPRGTHLRIRIPLV